LENCLGHGFSRVNAGWHVRITNAARADEKKK
jgi:hypothetical protein